MSSSNFDAPGAYPITPMDEEPMQQAQPNRLHKREDPRGWDTGIEQRTHPSGHSFADSGIYEGESSVRYGDYPSTTSQGTSQRTQPENQAPRSIGDDANPSGHHFSGSGIYVDDSSLSHAHQDDKSRITSGALSGTNDQDKTFTQNSNYTYGDKLFTPRTKDESPPRFDYEKPSASGVDDITPKQSLSEPNKYDSGANAFANIVHAQNNNTDKGLSEQQPSPEHKDQHKDQHKDPYWGDIPFGAGVYNGVTGHGSNESTRDRRSSRDQYNNDATNTGIYNGVTGHGSKEYTTTNTSSQQKSAQDQDQNMFQESTTDDDASHHQRAFPLVTKIGSGSASADHGGDDSGPQKHKSHFTEGLAGAGAAAAAGSKAAAHNKAGKMNDYDDNATAKDNDNNSVATKNKEEKHKRKDSGESKLHSLFHFGSHKNNNKDKEKEKEKEENKLQKNLPYRTKDEVSPTGGEEPRPVEYSRLSDGTPSGVAFGSTGQTRDHERDTSGSEQKSQYNTLSDGTPSGAALGGVHSHQQREKMSGSGRDRSAGSGSGQGQGQGQYNVLSSGTMSGVNLEQAHQQHAHQSKPQNQNQESQSQYQSTYHAKDAANNGQALDEFEMNARAMALKEARSKQADNNGKVNPDFAGGKGNEMSLSGGEAGGMSGRTVTHRCTQCGAENDITGYLRS